MWYINNLTNIVINYIANHRSKMQKCRNGNFRRFRFRARRYPKVCWHRQQVNHLSKKYASISQPFSSALRHASRFRFRVDAGRRVASRRVSSLANLDNRHRLTIARGKAEREDGGSVRDWSRRFNGTDSQGKVSRSIVPALVSFINVIPVYEMRGALVFTWFPF